MQTFNCFLKTIYFISTWLMIKGNLNFYSKIVDIKGNFNFNSNLVDNIYDCNRNTFYYQISREKFEPESGFKPRTSGIGLRSDNLNFPRHKL